MNRTVAFIAIILAQVLVMATLHIARHKGLWQSGRKAELAVFVLEVGFVSISLLVADLIF